MIIDSPRDTAALHLLWQRAFGDTDAFIQDFFRLGFQKDRCLCAYEEQQLTAALYWFDCQCGNQRFAYLYAVATDPAFQGQGICRSLMEHTHRHLHELGYAGTILVPGSPELFAMYGKFGYRSFGGICKSTCTAAATAAPIREIDSVEYARLRRQLLPECGVVQEGASLAFLRSQADFYAGNGWVCCAARSEDTLVIPELLGNASVAPGIVKALGCNQGHFRTPGSQAPFAMYLPLAENCIAPAYFGLAFD